MSDCTQPHCLLDPLNYMSIADPLGQQEVGEMLERAAHILSRGLKLDSPHEACAILHHPVVERATLDLFLETSSSSPPSTGGANLVITNLDAVRQLFKSTFAGDGRFPRGVPAAAIPYALFLVKVHAGLGLNLRLPAWENARGAETGFEVALALLAARIGFLVNDDPRRLCY